MTRTLRLNATDRDTASRAAQALSGGGLVALPTETVYGLAVDAQNEDAVKALYAAKGRPSNNPLICHVTGQSMANRYVDICETASQLMTAFWPGPLTLVLPLKHGALIAPSVQAGLSTLAVRCPDTSAMQQVISTLGRPVAAPSANKSGRLSPTSANDVLEQLGGEVDMIVDGGPTRVGIESTIVGIMDGTVTLLRPGTVTPEMIANITGQAPKAHTGKVLTAPGQLASHYAPNAPVRLNALSAEDGEVLVGFGAVTSSLTLSASGDLDEAAQKLFSILRAADSMGAKRIAVAPVPDEGIGLAINDRLRRAAAPRGAGTQ